MVSCLGDFVPARRLQNSSCLRARIPSREENHMEFRWVAIITLWTLLAGPIFDSPLASPSPRSQRPGGVAKTLSARR
jgi:hypothetical protein